MTDNIRDKVEDSASIAYRGRTFAPSTALKFNVSPLPTFKCFLQSNRVLITCNEKLAEFIQINGICYHASWMRKSKATDIQAELVNVIEIGQEEYENINSTIQDSNGELTDEEAENMFSVWRNIR